MYKKYPYSPILLAAATEMEIDPLIRSGVQADVLITGAGVPSSIFHLTEAILQHRYHMVIQAGIAGSFKGQKDIGNVYFVTEDRFADLGIYEHKKLNTLFEYGLSTEHDLLVNPHHYDGLPGAKGITVNMVTEEKAANELMQKKFAADLESMEGAALHYVCMNLDIPFIQVRAISNVVGERDKTKWKMKEAIENLNKTVHTIINEHLDFYKPQAPNS